MRSINQDWRLGPRDPTNKHTMHPVPGAQKNRWLTSLS